MPIRLHRCKNLWVKGPHPCWQVQKALDEAGADYEVVTHPGLPRGRRKDLMARTGQNKLPVIELEDGTMVREESKDLAARVRAGDLGAPRQAE
jgi:glutathione S-transferase